MKDFEEFQSKIESMFKSISDIIQQLVKQKPAELGHASTSVPRAEERHEVRIHGRQPRAGLEPDFDVVEVDEDDLDEGATRVSSLNSKRSKRDRKDSEVGPNDLVSQAGGSTSQTPYVEQGSQIR